MALEGLPCFTDPNILFGTNAGDDTGVYKLREDLAIVQTVDFFTPIVDDPYDFGAIAAANSISDCFTMGAKVVTGLNLVSYPCNLGLETLGHILRGGAEKMAEAGGVIIGGHSVDDPEPKYGIAITGVVDPREMVTNQGAKPGDALVLTKKIGTGIITNTRKTRTGFGRMIGAFTGGNGNKNIRDAVYEEAVAGMKTLNRKASELMVEVGVGACTDITGFGLLGHAHNLAEASGVMVELSYDVVPKFEGIEPHAIAGTKGGGERNRHWIGGFVQLENGIGDTEYAVLTDAQTSGPLLIAVDATKADLLVQTMKEAGVPAPAVIGRVLEGGEPGRIRVVP